jgi:hypothetical protein
MVLCGDIHERLLRIVQVDSSNGEVKEEGGAIGGGMSAHAPI